MRQAASDAGMSKDQEVTAVRVALCEWRSSGLVFEKESWS